MVHVTGYPGEPGKDSDMYTMNGKIQSVKPFTPYRIFYDIDTSPGQSGSGVWLKHSLFGYCCIGVHAYGIDPEEPYNYNSGTRITDEKLNNIYSWMKPNPIL